MAIAESPLRAETYVFPDILKQALISLFHSQAANLTHLNEKEIMHGFKIVTSRIIEPLNVFRNL
jgi:hypothetical protein